jgi:hypothetical protein
MLMLLIVAVGFLTVPLAGGRLTRLLELDFRGTWAVFASIAIQVLIVSVLPGGNRTLHVALHVASYGLAGYFVIRNRRIPGLWLIGAGGALNFLAIVANQGVMPASRAADQVAGIDPSNGFSNSAALAHPKLLFLGDVFAVPGPWPLGNVFSVGDVVLVVGTLLLIHRTCRAAVHVSDPGRSPA